MRRLTTFLGIFSLALGALEIVAPGTLGRAIGLRRPAARRALVRGYGVREIAAGALILGGRRADGVWSRVLGDLLDLASLARVAPRGEAAGAYAAATAAVAGITVVDALCATALEPR